MNIKRHIISCLLLFAFATTTHAQIGCEYQLELYDTFGDGWNGGFMTVTINGKSETYNFTNNYILSIPLYVLDGDSVDLAFTAGFFPFEASFRLFDAEGEALFYSGNNPPDGILFSTTVDCPACPDLILSSVRAERIRHDQATITWTMNDPEALFLLKYGPKGVAPEAATLVQVTAKDRYQLKDLEEHRQYDVYLEAVCANGDTSNQIGPFTFQTLWARDVGVEVLVSPVSDCDLPSDGVITLVLKNYGGAPQTLIPFNYSVNGMPGAVNQPNDGLFTGILSFDSTFQVSFDATFDFSNPQPYELKVWTELDGDKDAQNDTIRATIIHTPLIDEFPYGADFESGNGGWMLHPDSQNPSLELGRPRGSLINSASSGLNAWVTNLDGNYNNRERSMLLSPCLDFSGLSKDPELSFALWVITEPTFDGAWVETSVDGGPWTKLGKKDGSGSSWYNTIDDINSDWWTGDNIFGGWRKVRHPLTGLAGEADVRIRIVFRSDEAVVKEGIAIDDILIAEPLDNNLVAKTVSYSSDEDCGSEETLVQLVFRNEGAISQTGFSLSYQINNEPVITEMVSMQLAPEAQASYTFLKPFNSSIPAEYVIKAWTMLPGEEYPANDTATVVLSTAGPGIPYLETFESGEIPDDWTVDSDGSVESSHNSGSYVLFDNLWKDDQTFSAITPLLGPIAAGDTLLFSYRFVNFMGFGTQPTILSAADALQVEVSEDCGASFNQVLVINSSNHQVKNTPTIVRVPLQDFTGQWIKVRFRASWGGGDYYIDLDNINIRRCPPTFDIRATVVQPTGNNNNGSIRLEPAGGISPYHYSWSNGVQQGSVSGLAPGIYEITVSDQQGCRDHITVQLAPLVDSHEPLSVISSVRLAPNPTSGTSMLDVSLDKAYDLELAAFDARGVQVQRASFRQINRLDYPLDLNGLPDGLYFIRLLVQNEVKTIRLLKANQP